MENINVGHLAYDVAVPLISGILLSMCGVLFRAVRKFIDRVEAIERDIAQILLCCPDLLRNIEKFRVNQRTIDGLRKFGVIR